MALAVGVSRSYLFFAGANQTANQVNAAASAAASAATSAATSADAGVAASARDDGVMTALELAGLNLLGTKLVVLSACDTGVGEIKNGDGVYGLRRALTLAGAETQMISLWPVADKATRALMVGYYRALQAGQGRSAGLRAVRLQLIRDPQHRHPYYWASFIQSGEWGALQ